MGASTNIMKCKLRKNFHGVRIWKRPLLFYRRSTENGVANLIEYRFSRVNSRPQSEEELMSGKPDAAE